MLILLELLERKEPVRFSWQYENETAEQTVKVLEHLNASSFLKLMCLTIYSLFFVSSHILFKYSTVNTTNVYRC